MNFYFKAVTLKLLFVVIYLFSKTTNAQIRMSSYPMYGVDNSSAFFDASSDLGLSQTNDLGKGLTFPRSNLTLINSLENNGVSTGQTDFNPYLFDGMIVYNIGSGLSAIGNDSVYPGFYYYRNTDVSQLNQGHWVRFLDATDISNINAQTLFIRNDSLVISEGNSIPLSLVCGGSGNTDNTGNTDDDTDDDDDNDNTNNDNNGLDDGIDQAATNRAPSMLDSSRIILGYFPSWTESYPGPDSKLRSVPSYVNYLFLGFARPNMRYIKGSYDINNTGIEVPYDGCILKESISALKDKGIKVILSVGGETYWNNSDAYNINYQQIKDFVDDIGFAGIDWDYEPDGSFSGIGTATNVQHFIDFFDSSRALMPRSEGYILACAPSGVGALGGQTNDDPNSPWRYSERNTVTGESDANLYKNSIPNSGISLYGFSATGHMIPVFNSVGDKIDLVAYQAYNVGAPINRAIMYDSYAYYAERHDFMLAAGVHFPEEPWGPHYTYNQSSVADLAKHIRNYPSRVDNNDGVMIWQILLAAGDSSGYSYMNVADQVLKGADKATAIQNANSFALEPYTGGSAGCSGDQGGGSNQSYCNANEYNPNADYETPNTFIHYNCNIYHNKWFANPGEVPGVDGVWELDSACTESPDCEDGGPIANIDDGIDQDATNRPPSMLDSSRVILAYFPSWQENFPTPNSKLRSVPSHVNYLFLGFAKPNMRYVKGSYDITNTGVQVPYDGCVLKESMSALKDRGVQVILSVGGETYWHDHDAYNIDYQQIKDFVDDIGFAGIDWDYEPDGVFDSIATPENVQHFRDFFDSSRALMPRSEGYILACAPSGVGALGGAVNDDPNSPYAYSKRNTLSGETDDNLNRPTMPNSSISSFGFNATGHMIPVFDSVGYKIDLVAIQSYNAGAALNRAIMYDSYAYYAEKYGFIIAAGLHFPPEPWGPYYTYNHNNIADLSKHIRNHQLRADNNDGVMIWQALLQSGNDSSAYSYLNVADQVLKGADKSTAIQNANSFSSVPYTGGAAGCNTGGGNSGGGTTGGGTATTYCGAAEYDATSAYPTSNTKVHSNCKIYYNKWYANPGESPGSNAVWEFESNCSEHPNCP